MAVKYADIGLTTGANNGSTSADALRSWTDISSAYANGYVVAGDVLKIKGDTTKTTSTVFSGWNGGLSKIYLIGCDASWNELAAGSYVSISGTGSAANTDGFILTNCFWLEFKHIQISNYTRDGVRGLTTASSRIAFSFCKMNNMVNGVYGRLGAALGNIDITDCCFESISVNAVDFGAIATINTVRRCSFKTIGNSGVTLVGSPTVIIEDNVFNVCTQGVFLQPTSGAAYVARNTFYLCTNGVYVNAIVYIQIFAYNRFVNNNVAVLLVTNTMVEGRDNAYYGNATRVSLAGTTVFLEQGTINMLSSGFIDAANNDFNLLPSAEGRRISALLPCGVANIYKTIGASGADICFPDIKEVIPSVLPTTGGTIRIIYQASDSTAGLTAASITAGGVAAVSRNIISGTEVEATFGILTAGQKDIVAVSTAGTATASKGITVQAGLTVPAAPTVTGYATGKYANLAWTMAATSVTYDIETNGVVTTGYSTLSASLAMARANTDYVFRVRGVNSVGNGAWSTAITVRTEDVADDETIALAGSTVLSSVEDISGEIHIAQGMTGAVIFDPMILPTAISQETFEYYVKDVMHNTGRNVL